MTASARSGAEILCIGTELLLGEILNSNAQFLAQELAALGIPHHIQTVVGDNIDRIHQRLHLARSRSQILLVTGGLGPTPDDLTHEAIAQFFHTPMHERPELLAEIEARFVRRGRRMAASNRKQALLPSGASPLPNPVGSAPGMVWEPEPDFFMLTFPGVPREMQSMWRETAVPLLRSRGWGQEIFHSQVLRYWGLSESELAEQVGELFDRQNPTVAPYAGRGEVRLRVTARAASIELARQLMQPTVEQLRQIGGNHYFGSDRDTLASVTGDLLRQAGQTVAVAESCTGGWLGRELTSIPGSSDYFVGGVVAYANVVKQQVLGVSDEVIASSGAVSAEVAVQMAAGGRRLCGSDWSLSVTGIAGPGGGTETKPVGLVYIGLAGPDGRAKAIAYQFGESRGRDWVRWMSVQSALDWLRRRLQAEGRN